MRDVVIVALIGAFFGGAVLYVRLCERIVRRHREESLS